MAVLLEISAFEHVDYLIHNSLTPFEKICRAYSHHFSLLINFYGICFQRTEDGRQRTEVRGRKTEDRSQRTEDRGQKSEDGRQRAEIRERKIGVRFQVSAQLLAAEAAGLIEKETL